MLAPHPMFQGLAPGTIVAVADHSSEPFCVEFYDGLQASCTLIMSVSL